MSTMVDWLHRDRRRIAAMIAEENGRFLYDCLWLDDAAGADTPYRMLRQPIGHVYQRMAASMFDPNVAVYERLMRRAAEHGFLRYFKQRDERINHRLFVAEHQQRDKSASSGDEAIVYRALRMSDLQMAFATLTMIWTVGSVVCVVECCTMGWRVWQRLGYFL